MCFKFVGFEFRVFVIFGWEEVIWLVWFVVVLGVGRDRF